MPIDPRLGSWDSFALIKRKVEPLFKPLGGRQSEPDQLEAWVGTPVGEHMDGKAELKDPAELVEPRKEPVSIAFYGKEVDNIRHAMIIHRPLPEEMVLTIPGELRIPKKFYLHQAESSKRFYYSSLKRDRVTDIGQDCGNSNNLDWYEEKKKEPKTSQESSENELKRFWIKMMKFKEKLDGKAEKKTDSSPRG